MGCTPDHPQSTFNVAGPVAESQLTLFYWILAAAVFVFVIVTAILFWAVFRYRRKVSDKDPEQIHGNTKLEIAWTILPAIILVFVAIPTVITIFDNATSQCTYEEGCLEVTVEAAQWFWNFTYKDPSNPDLEVMTSNEMRIPVDEVVNIRLTSRDVLHSFWIPNIAGKLDIVPNHVNTMWIQSNIEGEIVTTIQKAKGAFDGIIINAAGYTHTSVAILDALLAIKLPTIEVHITNIYNREEFRKKSLISKAANGIICGFGVNGYIMALDSMKEIFNK